MCIQTNGIVVMTTIYPTAAAAALSFLYLGRFILQNGAISERASDMSFSFTDPLVYVWKKKKKLVHFILPLTASFLHFSPLPSPPLLLLTAATAAADV